MHLFQLTSPDIQNDHPLPARYMSQGASRSPAFTISGIPAATVSLALIFHDPDAPYGDAVRWTAWNIKPNTHIVAAHLPAGAVEGTNSYGNIGYDNPRPPLQACRFIFDLYALECWIGLHRGAPEEDMRMMVTRHAIAKASLVSRSGAQIYAQ